MTPKAQSELPITTDLPIAIDLFAGKGGWSQGLAAAGWRVIGFDIEQMGYPETEWTSLVLQDVLTLVAEQFRGKVGLIVASPPCQTYSYMSMPWSLAKKKREEYEASEAKREELNALFLKCFEIGDGAGVPLIVENVKGAQKWVGRAGWKFGSFYLWGNREARRKMPGRREFERVLGVKGKQRMKYGSWCGPRLWKDREVVRLNDPSILGRKNTGGSWFNIAHNTTSGVGQNPVNGIKGTGGSWFVHPNAADPKQRAHWKEGGCVTRLFSSKSPERKAASAEIAKIPFTLSYYIGLLFHPDNQDGLDF